MKNRIIFLVCTLLLIGCASSKNMLVGVFKHTDEIGGVEYVEIYKDSTFLYTSSIPFLSSTSKGKLFLKENQFVLKSFDSYKSNYFETQEFESHENKNSVRFVSNNNTPLPNMLLLLNENQIIQSNISGKIEDIVIKKNDKIKVKYITQYLDNEYSIRNDYDFFDIKIIIYPRNYKFSYLNDKVIFKKNKIVINKRSFSRVKSDIQ